MYYGNIHRKILLGRNFTLHFTSHLPIALSKIMPHVKTIKTTKKLSIFRKNESRLFDILKLVFFETLIIFPEPTIKVITGICDFQN